MKMCAFAFFVLFVVVASQTAEATTVPRLSLDDLIDQSGLIVEGTVHGVQNNAGSRQSLATVTYTFCDLSIIEGSAGRHCLEITTPGGVAYDGYVEEMEGMPAFEEGKRYLLFLTKKSSYYSPVTGWWQGAFEITKNSKGERALLTLDGDAIEGIDADGFVSTKRSVRVINLPEDLGQAEVFENRRLPEKEDKITRTDKSMLRDDFVDTIRMVSIVRRINEKTTPQQLPSVWRVVDSRKPSVATPQ